MLHSKSEDGHALIIDAGEKMYHLNFNQKFVLEKWREAFLCSMQTAREIRLSITGVCKNISKLIYDFDDNRVKTEEEIKNKFKDALFG